MRKLVIVVITIFAVFTFIREYPSEGASSRTVQRSSVEASSPN